MLLVFRFTAIYRFDGLYYFITVMDKEHRLFAFTMNDKSGSWKINEPVKMPLWLNATEPDLINAIKEHQ